MCSFLSWRVQHSLVVVVLALALLALVAPDAAATPSSGTLSAAALPAWDMSDIVHDRSRLVQFSIVAVAIGIALLYWGRKT